MWIGNNSLLGGGKVCGGDSFWVLFILTVLFNVGTDVRVRDSLHINWLVCILKVGWTGVLV
jgi:hypothetical protein